MSLNKFILGTSKKFTWISSGDTPTSIILRVYNGSETLVSSIAGTSSGNGHYYANVPFTGTNFVNGFYSYDWLAIMNSRPYVSRNLFKLIPKEVD